ncbi:hypothetical protein HCC18_04055 [Listeria booriae]|uniref:hypothetical protein n=1 Tax=Listeria booriae TaxID=1552123 RepID=UPI0016297DE9|nr:hypothetical protein [Listeria booriae]MBC2316003.1 hypothetical protein [Listeria booriae]
MFGNLRTFFGVQSLVASVLSLLFLLYTNQFNKWVMILKRLTAEQQLIISFFLLLLLAGVLLIIYPGKKATYTTLDMKLLPVKIESSMLVLTLVLITVYTLTPEYKPLVDIPVLILLASSFVVLIFSILISLVDIAFQKFKDSVPEGKDRYTIILGVFATVISLIAIFK